ncbi:MAG: ATP-binding cassette domain-containing protein [Clostridiales bacterium]|nr:ATP-binding cassette domain-containing protein [Clostridiales bacterium]
MEKISVQDVTFTYGSEGADVSAPAEPAVENLSLEIEKGSYTAVLGANGSGKSTLAKLIDVIEVPDSGRIVVFGKDTADDAVFWQIREKSACVFQNPDNQIVGTIVEEDVAFGPENLGIKLPELRERVDQAMKDVGIYELRLREASSLSGGQKQKLAIAGALAMRPEVLILDEATAMLDPKSRDEFLKVAEEMRIRKGLTLITITHDMSEAMRCGRIIVLSHGKKAAEGTPAKIFADLSLEQYGLRRPVTVRFAYEIARLAGRALTEEDLSGEARLRESLVKILTTPGLKEPDILSSGEVNNCAASSRRKVMSVKDLFSSYDNGKTFALKNISLDVYEGEILGIVGESGCGKTTLISHMNSIIKPTSGEIEIYPEEGSVLCCSHKKDVQKIRQTVGLVFQYPEYQLFDETVYKDICYGLRKMKLSAEEQKDRAVKAAKSVGLSKDVLRRNPFELSGGQKRRAAMAGVLAMRPKILVLDEPASGLDPVGREEMFALIRSLRDEGTTIVIVSHNMDEAAAYCDRICCIKDGEAVVTETPGTLFTDREKTARIGIDQPKITKFSGHLKEDIKKLLPEADFGRPVFDPEEEARAVYRAVLKAGLQDVK